MQLNNWVSAYGINCSMLAEPIVRRHGRRGFNLIEISIVLAVIGLVIGGIYVAASALSENNRRLNLRKLVLQTALRVREVYAYQPYFTAPTDDQIKKLGLFPTVDDNKGAFLSVYGYKIRLADQNQCACGMQNFYLSFYGLPTDACIDLLSGLFGNGQAVLNAGLISAGAYPNNVTNISEGITPAKAAAVCINTSSWIPNTNEVSFVFSLH